MGLLSIVGSTHQPVDVLATEDLLKHASEAPFWSAQRAKNGDFITPHKTNAYSAELDCCMFLRRVASPTHVCCCCRETIQTRLTS